MMAGSTYIRLGRRPSASGDRTGCIVSRRAWPWDPQHLAYEALSRRSRHPRSCLPRPRPWAACYRLSWAPERHASSTTVPWWWTRALHGQGCVWCGEGPCSQRQAGRGFARWQRNRLARSRTSRLESLLALTPLAGISIKESGKSWPVRPEGRRSSSC
jgi:hypothetical protein